MSSALVRQVAPLCPDPWPELPYKARLLALQGLSDRQIGQALRIPRRTWERWLADDESDLRLDIDQARVKGPGMKTLRALWDLVEEGNLWAAIFFLERTFPETWGACGGCSKRRDDLSPPEVKIKPPVVG